MSETFRIAKELEPFAREIGLLMLDPDNAREHDDANILDIANSLKTYGQQKPVVVNSAGKIVAGNGTVRAALSLGWTRIAVITFDGPVEDEEGFAIADNRSAERATWNEARLGPIFERYRAAGLNLRERLGFKESEAQNILVRLGRGSATQPDDVPACAPARARTGDVWMLGRHRLVCGDSAASDAAVGMALGGELADCVWTDPPYGIGYAGGGRAAELGKEREPITNDALGGDAFVGFLRFAFGVCIGAMKPGATIYVSHADMRGLEFRTSFAQAGFKLAGCLVWAKNRFTLGHSDYQWQHEPILYGWKPGAGHRWFGGRDCGTVFEVPSPHVSSEHPTMKPVDLVRRMIENSTMPSDLVLDPFGGSGSTLIACEVTGRRCATVEIAPKFCDVIMSRWASLTGGAPVQLVIGAGDAASHAGS